MQIRQIWKPLWKSQMMELDLLKLIKMMVDLLHHMELFNRLIYLNAEI